MRTKPPTQQRSYGVLVSTIRDGREDPGGKSPGYEIWVRAGQNYRIAVNVRLVDLVSPLYHTVDDDRHPGQPEIAPVTTPAFRARAI
jgi:hypothetical protein